jgi:hypothetical protein
MSIQYTQKNESNQREWTQAGLHSLNGRINTHQTDPGRCQFHIVRQIERALIECGLTKSEDKRFWLNDRYYIKCILNPIKKTAPKVVIYDSHTEEDAVNLFVIEMDDFVNLFERIREFWDTRVQISE